MYNCVFRTAKGAEIMTGCEEIECYYCVTHDEDRVEFCAFYDCACWYVRKCKYFEEQLKENK